MNKISHEMLGQLREAYNSIALHLGTKHSLNVSELQGCVSEVFDDQSLSLEVEEYLERHKNKKY